MERNARSIIPPSNAKSRNGPTSPRDRDMNNSGYANHQPSHYNSYNNNNSQNHHGSGSVSPKNEQQQQQHHQPAHPNTDLINFVHGAWKEKATCAVFEVDKNSDKLINPLDTFEGWLRKRQY